MANIRCSEIAADQLAALEADQAWCSLQQGAERGLLPGFGALVGDLLDSNLAGATQGTTERIHELDSSSRRQGARVRVYKAGPSFRACGGEHPG